MQKGIPLRAEKLADKHKQDIYVIREGENNLFELKEGLDCFIEYARIEYEIKFKKKAQKTWGLNYIIDQIDKEDESFPRLVYHHKYEQFKGDLTFEQAKQKADIRAAEYGGNWHVIEIRRQRIIDIAIAKIVAGKKKCYEEVHETYLKEHKVASLYKAEGINKIDFKKLFPDMNREKRRKLERKLNNGKPC